MHVLVTSTAGYGHIDWGGILPTLKKLKERGHKMIIGSGKGLEPYILSKGFEFLDLGLKPPKKFDPKKEHDIQSINHLKEWFFNPEALIQSIEIATRYVKDNKIDLIISECMYQGAPIISKLTEKPFIVLGADGKKQKQDNLKKRFPDLPETLDNKLSKVYHSFGLEKILPALPRMYSPYLNIIFTTREFENNLENEDIPHVHYVGGDSLEKKKISDKKLKEFIKDHKTNIFATSGTIFWKEELLELYQTLARKLKIGVVVGAGGILPKISKENIFCIDFADYEEIFPHMNLIVSHCGTGTMTSAIRAGKPILGMPIMVQQASNAKRIEDYGNGIIIFSKEISQKEFVNAIKELIKNKSYQKKAEKLQKSFSSEGGYDEAVRLIEKFAK